MPDRHRDAPTLAQLDQVAAAGRRRDLERIEPDPEDERTAQEHDAGERRGARGDAGGKVPPPQSLVGGALPLEDLHAYAITLMLFMQRTLNVRAAPPAQPGRRAQRSRRQRHRADGEPAAAPSEPPSGEKEAELPATRYEIHSELREVPVSDDPEPSEPIVLRDDFQAIAVILDIYDSLDRELSGVLAERGRARGGAEHDALLAEGRQAAARRGHFAAIAEWAHDAVVAEVIKPLAAGGNLAAIDDTAQARLQRLLEECVAQLLAVMDGEPAGSAPASSAGCLAFVTAIADYLEGLVQAALGSDPATDRQDILRFAQPGMAADVEDVMAAGNAIREPTMVAHIQAADTPLLVQIGNAHVERVARAVGDEAVAVARGGRFRRADSQAGGPRPLVGSLPSPAVLS